MPLQLSDDTESVLDYLDKAVEGGLRKRLDIGVLLELGATHNEADLFNSTVRTGTGLWKVHGTLKRVGKGDEGFRLLEQEFGLQLNELRELLARIMQHADDDTVRRFDEIYFGMTQGVVLNLIDLAHDLAKIKALQKTR